MKGFSRVTGFTVVEIAVAVAVVGCVLALGVPNYAAFLKNSQVRNLAESIVDGLNIARMEAVNRNEPVTFTLTGNDWSVDVPATGERVQARIGAEGSSQTTITSTATTTGPLTVAFNGLGRITSGNASTVLTITAARAECIATAPTRCLRVQMSTGGRVRMCDPALSADDAQACA